MSQTITISDMLYTRLRATADQRGLQTIEQLLEALPEAVDESERRRRVVEAVEQRRDQIYRTYGEMADSVSLVREDRAR